MGGIVSPLFCLSEIKNTSLSLIFFQEGDFTQLLAAPLCLVV